jgi:hypothetical protein
MSEDGRLTWDPKLYNPINKWHRGKGWCRWVPEGGFLRAAILVFHKVPGSSQVLSRIRAHDADLKMSWKSYTEPSGQSRSKTPDAICRFSLQT